MPTNERTITLVAVEEVNLDTTCYRGSASLADLAQISQADVFDQETNPKGLQRDLSKRHAIEAYDYVSREPDRKLPRAFPEVVLNARDARVVKVASMTDMLVKGDVFPELVRLTFDLDAIEKARGVKVSRVDGNHRLMFANGDGKDRPPLTATAPFQIHVGLSQDQERSLFLDLNANQKGLNTSHLAVMRTMLTDEQIALIREPWRVFALRLARDTASPWFDMVHLGGSKAGTKKRDKRHPVNFVALETGIKRLLSRSQHLKETDSADEQYALVLAYWQAVKATWPDVWEAPFDSLITRSIGINALSQFGGNLIDRCMAAGDVDAKAMGKQLATVKGVYDWHKDARGRSAVSGMSGNRAVNLIAGELTKKLPKLAAK